MPTLAAKLGAKEFLLVCAERSWNMWTGGNQHSGYAAYLSFFRHIAQLKLDYSKWQHWEELALHSGPRIVHKDFCMISDRPEVLLVDEQNRPHCEDGPFCRWRDGSALYAVHGVRLPWWIIEYPERITVALIDAEQNAEVRRVMVSKFGMARYLTESGSTVIHQLPADYPLKGLRSARLLRREQHDDEPIVAIECHNSTPEPDGSIKIYHLRIDPNAYGGRAGRECHAAMASTWRNEDGSLFFDRPEDYAPEIET